MSSHLACTGLMDVGVSVWLTRVSSLMPCGRLRLPLPELLPEPPLRWRLWDTLTRLFSRDSGSESLVDEEEPSSWNSGLTNGIDFQCHTLIKFTQSGNTVIFNLESHYRGVAVLEYRDRVTSL